MLRYFVAVADAGSVTRAAASVRVAQPSVSRQIKQLEDMVGSALFQRSGGRLQLSAAGRVFLPVARDLLRRAELAEDYLRAQAEPDAISLSLVAPETTVADLIAPFLAQRRTDAASVMVREAIPDAVFGDVVAGTADVGISSGTAPAGMASRLIIRFAVLAYVPPGDELGRRRSVKIEDLARRPLIVLSPAHGTRRVFDNAIAEAGLRYEVAAEANVGHVAQAMAISGHGVAVVTDDRRYGLKPVFIDTGAGRLMLPLFAAWNPSHYAGNAIETLVTALAAYAETRYGSLAGGPSAAEAPTRVRRRSRTCAGASRRRAHAGRATAGRGRR